MDYCECFVLGRLFCLQTYTNRVIEDLVCGNFQIKEVRYHEVSRDTFEAEVLTSFDAFLKACESEGLFAEADNKYDFFKMVKFYNDAIGPHKQKIGIEVLGGVWLCCVADNADIDRMAEIEIRKAHQNK